MTCIFQKYKILTNACQHNFVAICLANVLQSMCSLISKIFAIVDRQKAYCNVSVVLLE